MKPRFTRYGNHQPSWIMHAEVSEKFKVWAKENEDAVAVLMLDPELFVMTIVKEMLTYGK